MKRELFLALSVLWSSAGAAGPGGQATAKVEWKHGPQPKVIVDETLWRCAGTVCNGPVIDRPVLTARACSKVARATGKVVRFATPAGEFSAEQLRRCNR
jgi:hypothetical protein